MLTVSTCWIITGRAVRSRAGSWAVSCPSRHSRAGATRPPVTASTSFRMWSAAGRLFDHPSCSASASRRSTRSSDAEEDLDLALRRPTSSMAGSGGVSVQEEDRDDKDFESQDAVNGVPDGDGGIPGLGERAGHVLRPVDLGTETGPVLEPGEEVQLGGLRQRLQLVQGVAGKAAPGKLVVDDGLGAAPGVLAPVRGKCGLYFHLMMSFLRF